MPKKDKLKLKSKNPIIFLTGNGFDLACGLKTRYSDFIKDLVYNKFYCDIDLDSLFKNESPQRIFYALKRTKDLSVWECYFYKIYQHNDDTTWIDIEKEIEKTFLKEGIWVEVYQQINFIIQYIQNDQINYLNPNNFTQMLSLLILNRYHDELKTDDDKKIIFDENIFLKLLKKELLIFESKFSRYLKGLDLKNKNYYSIRGKNLEKIESYIDGQYAIYCCSFNYTGLNVDEKGNIDKTNINFVGLHGDIYNPIFGIGNIESPLGSLEDFTKICRRRDAQLPTYYDLFSRGTFCNVAFYGISFGENDFTDLDILLDYVGVNDSIIIFYTNYNNEPDYFEKLYRSLRETFIKLGRANSPNAFDKMTQNGKIILYEIPREDFMTINS